MPVFFSRPSAKPEDPVAGSHAGMQVGHYQAFRKWQDQWLSLNDEFVTVVTRLSVFGSIHNRTLQKMPGVCSFANRIAQAAEMQCFRSQEMQRFARSVH